MQVYKIGALLRLIRTEKKISQSALCRGICSVQMVSLIEKERRVAHWKLVDLLYSRLGEDTPFELAAMTKSQFERYNIEFEINSLVAIGNADIKKLLEKYAAAETKMTKWEQQFFQFYSIVYENRAFSKKQWALDELTKTLKMTIPDYELSDLLPKQKLLSSMELIILNNISRLLYMLGNKKDGLALMEKLYGYTKHSWLSVQVRARLRPVFLFNLANWLDEKPEDWKASLKKSEEAFEICLKHGNLAYFPHHLFIKGYYSAKLGNIQHGKKMMIDALTCMWAIGKDAFANRIIDKINPEFNFDIPHYEKIPLLDEWKA